MPRVLRLLDATKLLAWIERWKIPPPLWLVGLWLLLVLPTIGLRSAHYEEGTVIGLARGALEDRHWLEPHLYGIRIVERPALLSWLLAVLSIPTGTVEVWFARIVAALIYLASGWLIFLLVRRYASALAALFAALCFFLSPMALQKVTTVEPDMLLGLLLFSAFLVWWRGEEEKKHRTARMVAVGLLLAAAALTKGPQPLAYFFLGSGAYVLVQRRWDSVPPLVVIGVIAAIIPTAWYLAVAREGDAINWLTHARLLRKVVIFDYVRDVFKLSAALALELLPGLLFAIPVALTSARRGKEDERSALVFATALFAVCCTVVLVFWPGARGRHAMPAAFAVAVLAGLAFDRFRTEKPLLRDTALAVLNVLLVYKLTLNWIVMPFAPSLFNKSRTDGEQIAAVIAQRPAPLQIGQLTYLNLNALLYVNGPKRIVNDVTAATQPPAWAIVSPEQEKAWSAARPDLLITPRLVLKHMRDAHLVEVTSR